MSKSKIKQNTNKIFHQISKLLNDENVTENLKFLPLAYENIRSRFTSHKANATIIKPSHQFFDVYSNGKFLFTKNRSLIPQHLWLSTNRRIKDS